MSTKPEKDRPAALSRERRAKVRRARQVQRALTGGMIAIVVVGLIGLGVWLLLSPKPEATIEVYPVEYEAQIRRRAAENGLDPAYPAAVILAESSYQPEAVSSANAQGLMQLLPDTAAWVAGKFDEEYAEGCLFDPDTNIKYGCWYLGWLVKRFNGNLACATAAYHAGQGQVDQWLKNPEYSPDGATLALIPSQVTDTYVKRVLKYYEKYCELYAPEAA